MRINKPKGKELFTVIMKKDGDVVTWIDDLNDREVRRLLFTLNMFTHHIMNTLTGRLEEEDGKETN